MTVVITGGAGFLGQRLARALLQKGVLRGADGRPEPIDRLVLVDVARPRGPHGFAARRSRRRRGGSGAASAGDRRTHAIDLSSRGHRQRHGRGRFRSRPANQRRRVSAAPRRLSASGPHAAHRVHELGRGVRGRAPRDSARGHRPDPQTSYGTQKAIGELMLQRLLPPRVRGRTGPAPADDHSAPGPAERGGIVVCERDHPRASER